MISYDDYINRIQKLAKVKKFFHKFRFLFIGLLSLIIAATTGLLIAKGTVTTAMSLPAQISFGDDYSPTGASAFLSSVNYEYSLEGSGVWSSEKPVKAGKYLARAVTDKTFGKGYGEVVHFEIVPRKAEFTINSDSVVYGEVPERCSVSNLVAGQKLVTGDLRFTYASYTAQKTQVNVVGESIKITDGTGDDFTSCYDITLNGKELVIKKRPISLEAVSCEYTYTAGAVSVENEVTEYSKGQLAEGDTITVQNGIVDETGAPIPAPSAAGDYRISVKTFKIMKGKDDVTAQYDVKKVTAWLKIARREVTITTGSATKPEYDGTALSNTTFTSEGLIGGHKAFPIEDYVSITDAVEADNVNSFKIYDAEDNEVTDNYNIKTVYGKLKINKRVITVRTGDAQRVYDGNILYNYSYEIMGGSVVPEQSHRLADGGTYGIFNVKDSGANTLSIAIFAGKDDVTKNYDIRYVYGTLTLSERGITIETGTHTRTYNGKELEDKVPKITEGTLVPRHSAVAANEVYIINVGSIQNKVDFKIYDPYGEDVTDNYKITPVYGTLTIEKRPISVTTVTPINPYVYDGTYHSNTGYETKYYGDPTAEGVVLGQKLTVSNPAEILNVGSIENKFDITDESGNYDIKEITYGTLTVVARKITVVTATDEKVYDGKPLSNSGYTTYLQGDQNTFGLVEGDNLVLVGTPASIKNVGEIPNACSFEVPNDNYEIADTVLGVLKVTVRYAEVHLLDVNIEYGDLVKYPAGEGNIANADTCNLAEGEKIEVFVIFDGIEEGTTPSVDTYAINADEGKTKINGVEDTSNYAITYVSSTLTISERTVTVTTEDNTKVYDGTPLVSGSHSIEGILPAHEIYVIDEFGVVNVADSGYDQTTYGVRNKTTKEDLTGNYKIEYEYGYLEVTRRPLSVKSKDGQKIYDGEPLTQQGYTTVYFGDATKEGLIGEDTLTVTEYSSLKDAGEKDNVCVYECSDNYTIEENTSGKLKVTVRKIKVTTGSAEKVYDATPLTCDTYTTEYYDLINGDTNGNTFGLAAGDSLTLIGELAGITNKGTAANTNRYEEGTNYEIVGYGEDGTLTVTVRRITVVTGTVDDKVYDGKPLTCTTYTTYFYGNKNKDGLIEGDGELTLIGEPASVTNVGNGRGIQNKCKYSAPSANYEIYDYEYGTLRILPKDITVAISGAEDVTYGALIEYPAGIGNFANVDSCGLVNGEQMEIGVYYMNKDLAKCEQKDAGLYYIALDEETTEIYDKDGALIANGITNYNVTSVEKATASILPKTVTVTINSATATYGEIFEITYNFAPYVKPYGESIELGFKFTKGGSTLTYPIHKGEYAISVNKETCRVSRVLSDSVVAAAGDINNYEIIDASENATLTIDPRPITVQLLRDIEAEYGEEYSYDTVAGNYEGDCGLPYGDTLTVYPDIPEWSTLPDVGVYTFGALEEKTQINGKEDTSDYLITYLDGKFEITKRIIVVKTVDDDKIYDGTPLSNGDYTTRHWTDANKEGLLGEDELTLVGAPASLTNVDVIDNVCSYTEGSNYRILRTEYGTLEVKVRKIVIASASETWEYDGEYHSLPSLDEDESYHVDENGVKQPALVLDHSFVSGSYPEIKDVGWIYNTCFDSEIVDGEGNPVPAGNYEIDSESTGKLTVTPRPIVIKTHSDTKPYDGLPLENRGMTTYYFKGTSPDYGEGSEAGLVGSDSLTFVGHLAEDKVTVLSGAAYALNAWQGAVSNDNVYESPVGVYGNANYTIKMTISGVLEVTARPITVEIGDRTKEYDCAPYYVAEEPDNYQNYLGCDLSDGERLQIAITLKNEDGSEIEEGKFNACDYKIELDTPNCIVYIGDSVIERGIENYEVTCEGAKLTVTKRHVIVTQNDVTADYGDEIVYNGFETDRPLTYYQGVQEELTLTHHFENADGETISGQIRQGDYFVCADEDSVLIDGETPKNHTFEFVDGALTISPRRVEVTLKSINSTYGDAFAYPTGIGNYEGECDLGYDDTLEVFAVIEADEQPDVGTYPIVVDTTKSPLVNGNTDTSDYIFVFTDGELNVSERTISFGLIKTPFDITYGGVYNYPVGQGNYTGTPDLAYGQQLEVVVEFYLDGEKVLEHKKVGTYEIRLGSLKIFNNDGTLKIGGSSNYSYTCAPVTVKIIPKDITVTIDDSYYIYGNEAPEITYTTVGLEFSEVLTLGFLYRQGGEFVTPEDKGEYEIYSDETLTLIDGEADGVGNYNIEYNLATLTIGQRHIKVETATSSHVYDGKDYSDTFVNSYLSENAEEAGFVGGYQPEVFAESVPTVRNVNDGEIDNIFTFTVSDNYVIDDTAYGKIKVTKRPLSVELNSYNIIYGEEFTYPAGIGNYAGAEGLVEDETLEISASVVTDMEIPDVGTYVIRADESLTLINGVNDYSNYAPSFVDGSLNITVRKIIVASASGSWPYDGKPHSAPSENPDECYYINAEGKKAQPALVAGHSFLAGDYPTITNVGKITNTCYGGTVLDSEGHAVKEGNYEIDLSGSGTLEVTAIEIRIATGNAEREYNGEYLTSNEGTVIENALAEGEHLELGYPSRIKNVSENRAENNRSTFKVYDDVTGDETTKNYIISYKYGTLKILERPIAVVTPTITKAYDGTALRDAANATTYYMGNPEEKGLLGRDKLTVLTSVSITEVGTIKNDCTYNVSTNYKIMRVDAGDLTVTERHITVVTNGKTKVYDGVALSEKGYTTHLSGNEKKAGLVGSDKLTLDESTVVSITEVGTVSNTLSFTVGKNYIIDDYVYGDLTITRRPLIITTADDTKVYDGTALTNTNCTVKIEGTTEEGLLEGDSLTVTKTASLTEVGTAENACEYAVPNSNYVIKEVVPGTLEVTKARLEIVLKDVEDVDYGNTFTYPTGAGNYASVTGLVSGESLEVAVYYTDKNNVECNPPVDAGDYTVNIDVESSAITGTEKGIGNYQVVCQPKTAKINKLTLNIELTDSVEYGYDGTAHGYDSLAFSITGAGTIEGETLTVGVSYYDGEGTLLDAAPSDAGNYKIKLDKEGCLINGATDANINYEIVCASELDYKITPAKFTVTLSDVESTYDGEEYDYSESGNFVVEGLFGTDEIDCTVRYIRNSIVVTPIKADDYKVEFKKDSITFKSGNASNYEFDDTTGNHICNLKIKPRPIQVSVVDREIEFTLAVDPADERYKATSGVGGAAFVGDDEENAQATYYYDGKTEVPTALGTYYVSVKFLNEEVIKNYELTTAQGKLTIVGRKVLVTPVYTGGAKEYDGNAVDVAALVAEGKLSFTHVHDVEGVEEDDKYGFTDEDYAALNVVYEFMENDSGEFYSDGNTPKNAGNYYITVKITGYDTTKYQVTSDRTVDFFVITRKNLDVTSIADAEKQYDKKAPTAPAIEYSGLVATDEGVCTVVPEYYDINNQVVTAFNAGTYSIGAAVSDPSGATNYTIVYAAGAKGTLTITPVTLYVKPASKSEYYNGHNLYLSESDYLFVDGEGGEHSGLIEGDTLKITPSTQLDPSKTYTAVSIIGATVSDDLTGENMTGNYNIYYNYDRTVMGSGYNSGDFKGSLEFKLRTVHYNQIVPEGQGVFPYDGEVKTVTGSPLYEIVEVEGDMGLFSTDRIVVSSSKIGPQVGEYYDWLQLKVYDKNNKDVSRVYDLRLLNAEESVITIGVIKITLKIDASLTNEMLDSGEAFYTSSFDGRYALDTRYYTVEGIMPGHSCEVVAIKSAGVWNFAVLVYETKSSGSLSDKSDCYELLVEKPEELNAVCSIVECHSLATIKSDLNLKVLESYENIAAGTGLTTTYDGRSALGSSQYEIEGLLEGHSSEVIVLRSGGVLTLAVLVFEPRLTGGEVSGRSDRSYNYNLISELPADFSGTVNIVLTASLAEVKQDITINITADLQDIKDGVNLVETYDGRLALDSSLYTVEGLLEGHSSQVIAMASGGNVVLAVLVFEPKLTGGELSGRSDRSYLYNLIVNSAPEGAEVRLVSSLNEILTDIKITLNAEVTAENLAAGTGITQSAVDGRNVLSADMYTIENNFGVSPLRAGHTIEVIVDGVGDGTFNLYVIVYQLSSTGKRSDRSYLYTVTSDGTVENINVIYKTLPLGNEGII